MRNFGLMLAAGATLALAGCSQSVDFNPTQNATKVGSVESARYVLLAGPGQPEGPATVTLVGRGLVHPKDQELRNGAINVHVVKDNPTGTPITVTGGYLTDDHGHRLERSTTVRGGPVVRSAAATDWIFPLPSGLALGDVHSFTLHWTSEVAGQVQQRQTDFVVSPVAPPGFGENQPWQFSDTTEAQYTGEWYGILGPPFPDMKR